MPVETGEAPASGVAPIVEALYEPGRRGRWVAPLVLAGAGFCAVQNIVFRALLIPQSIAAADSAAAATQTAIANGGAAIGVVLATAGVFMGARGMRRIEPVFHSAWTIGLIALAGMSVPALAVFARLTVTADEQSIHVSRYIMVLLGVGAVTLFALAVLRWRRVRLAAVFTAALSLLMLVFFPLGTAASIFWFVFVRKRETSAL